MNIEHQHQVALFEWAAIAEQQYPELALMFAIPNGGARSKRTGAMLKREGVRAGVPDICLPVARHGCNALFIEMKSPTGKLSTEQRAWLRDLDSAGNSAVMCRGWQEARQVIEAYLSTENRTGEQS